MFHMPEIPTRQAHHCSEPAWLIQLLNREALGEHLVAGLQSDEVQSFGEVRLLEG
jgi:hypothetical protein